MKIYHLLVILFLTACKQEVCPKNELSCLRKAVNNHPIKTKKYWDVFLKVNPQKNIYLAPDELIDFITLDNRKSGYKERPKRPIINTEFLNKIIASYDEIPKVVKNKLDQKLIGIFLISDLGGTGFTDFIKDKYGNIVGAFIVLDVDILKQKKANEWASWKENTPFKEDPLYQLEMIIERKDMNTVKNAIQYILLHELGHVISLNEDIHPFWNIEPKDIKNLKDFSFINYSWSINYDENKYKSFFDKKEFPKRKDVIYYRKPKLKASEMKSVYTQLEKSNFVSLYGSINPADDWAEAFVTYIHTQMLKRPFEINIKENNKIIKQYKSCWNEKRCEKKKEYMQQFFEIK
jgi:hypothetical protein